MNSKDFSSYFEKPCRIKLKSGKEVFGVIWKENSDPNKSEHYFASSKEYEAYKKAILDDNYSVKKDFSLLSADEIISVEALENILKKD